MINNKLTHQIYEALDLDGRDPEGAKKYSKSKRVLSMILDRLNKSSNAMLKSLSLMSSQEKKSTEGNAAIQSVKNIVRSVDILDKLIGNVNGLSSLKVSNQNRKAKDVLMSFASNAKSLSRILSTKNISDATKNQIEKYLDDVIVEIKNIQKDVIKDL